MHQIHDFLDAYVRIDEGTRVLLCAHRSCVQMATSLHVAIHARGTTPTTVIFDHDCSSAEADVFTSLATLRAYPNARRVAVIVCELLGPSFVRIFEQGPDSALMPIFRITSPTEGSVPCLDS